MDVASSVHAAETDLNRTLTHSPSVYSCIVSSHLVCRQPMLAIYAINLCLQIMHVGC